MLSRNFFNRKSDPSKDPLDDCDVSMESVEQENHDESLMEDEASKIDELQKMIDQLQVRLKEAESENQNVRMKLEVERFGISRFSSDPDLIKFYTGFRSYNEFRGLFLFLEPVAKTMASHYYVSATSESSMAGKPRSMLLIDEFFLFLCRLRVGLKTKDLAVRFSTSPSSVSRKVITWANLLYNVLGRIPIWLPKENIQSLLPPSFKELFPNTRVIIDCCEIQIQQPSSLAANSQLYSHYKGRTTLKCLVGIAPHGALTFISPLYSGSMSDVEITRVSGLIDLLEPGDEVMADKGFTIKQLVAQKHASLTIPNFLRSKKQFTPEEISENEKIASVRIHVERYIRRIKEYKLFDTVLPLSLVGTAPQLWTIAGILANFQGPLIKDVNEME